MATTITNRSRQLLVVPLNSGATLHLAPGEEAPGIDPVEVKNNATLQKMAERGWIALAETREGATAHQGQKRGKGR
ncbi:MAG: hypothetical protein EPO39_01780 [Candidatus Manganitrophaceae bacterium]|nr:MAG: hypothetical protein EPO39_01780 [Candidatus Manganitrophaceae bacterium]